MNSVIYTPSSTVCHDCGKLWTNFIDWIEQRFVAEYRFQITSAGGWSNITFQGVQLRYCPFCGKSTQH